MCAEKTTHDLQFMETIARYAQFSKSKYKYRLDIPIIYL